MLDDNPLSKETKNLSQHGNKKSKEKKFSKRNLAIGLGYWNTKTCPNLFLE